MLGKTGVRIIAGDFNQDPANLEQVSLWLQQGWVECQSLAQRLWGRTPQPTCKHATQRDLVFLSPEAASLRCEVYVEEVFQERGLGFRFGGSHFTLMAHAQLHSLESCCA